MASKHRYVSRKWLNTDKTQSAYIICDIEGGHYPHGNVKIADCGRIVNLDFPCEGKKNKNHSIKKIDILLAELEAFREAVINSGD